jgi:hypothetical protein
MHTDPPMAQYIKRTRRPSLSISTKSQINVTTVLTTPNTPVVSSEVEVPEMPMDLKIVGL